MRGRTKKTIARDVLFRAWPETEINMVKLICEKVGTPTEANWPGVSKLKGYVTPSEVVPVRTKEYWMQSYRAIGETGVELLMAMLTLDPRKRLTAEGVLKHAWWTEEPRPSRLEDLPRKGGGMEVMGEDLKKRAGEVDGRGANGVVRGDRVARKIDFGAGGNG